MEFIFTQIWKQEEIPPPNEYRKLKQGDVTEHELGAALEEAGERLFEEMTLMLSNEWWERTSVWRLGEDSAKALEQREGQCPEAEQGRRRVQAELEFEFYWKRIGKPLRVLSRDEEWPDLGVCF